MLRRLAAARDAQSRIYVENGSSYKSRSSKRRKEIDEICHNVHAIQTEFDALLWEVFCNYISPWQHGRAAELGKEGAVPPLKLEVSGVAF